MRFFNTTFKTCLAISSLLLAFATTQSHADSYYKWVDDQGVTHYGERAPKNTKAQKGKTQTGHSEPSVYTPAETDKKTSAAAASAKYPDPARCESAKQNLETINTSSRIKVADENGEYHYLSQEDIKKRKQEAQKAINESC